MGLSFVFGTGTSWQASWLDTDFAEVGACATIPCAASGTNTIILAPIGNTPVGPYAPYQRYGFIAAGTNTGAATANYNSQGALAIYKDTGSGPVALTGNEIVADNYCVVIYDPALNTGAGGFHLTTAPSTNVGTVTSVLAGTGLAGGTITGAGTISFGTIANLSVLANVSGGNAAASANTVSAILDAVFGTTQGSVLYRGASLWARLSPGSAAQFLYSGGASANPSWQGGIATGLSAAGTIQSTATLLAAGYNQVGTVGAGAGVILATTLGVEQWIWNDGANALLVYPPTGAQINNLGSNNPATISTLSSAGYVMLTSSLAKSLP